MAMEMVYLIACLAITMGAYYAAYLFARKDDMFYAICFFLVASGAFYGAASMVRSPAAVQASQAPTTVPSASKPNG